MSAPAADARAMHAPTADARRAAIVAGGSSGVGAAAALLLARRGYDVIIGYHRGADAAEQVAAACRAAGADATALRADVSSDADCRALAVAAAERWGRIDALVHSAGATRFVPLSNLEGVSGDDFRSVFDVNAVGPFQMVRAAAPHLGPGSAVVCVSSIAALSGNGSSLPYVVSKAALNALTLGLARALAPNVRVNAVLPGLVEGRWMREGLGEAAYERVKRQYAENALLERVATPEHIASAIAWLLDPACLMTGQLMVVDAGFGLGRPPAAAGAR